MVERVCSCPESKANKPPITSTSEGDRPSRLPIREIIRDCIRKMSIASRTQGSERV